MTEKRKLLNQLQMYNFAVIETGLYLDTHPHDARALAYFNKMKRTFKTAKKEYEEKYGPTVMTSNDSEKQWDWALSKWPWEVEK